jgi:hypothetical protein
VPSSVEEIIAASVRTEQTFTPLPPTRSCKFSRSAVPWPLPTCQIRVRTADKTIRARDDTGAHAAQSPADTALSQGQAAAADLLRSSQT